MRSNAIVSCLLLLLHSICCDEDNWIEPNAWAEHTQYPLNSASPESCQCPALRTPEKSLAGLEDQLALTYFKKFIRTLFNREKLQYSKTEHLYKRSVLFTLLPAQIDELEKIEDVRDIDILLNNILGRAEDLPLFSNRYGDYSYTHKGMGVFALIADIFKDLLQLLKLSEVKFLLAVLVAFSLGWIVRKTYRIPVLIIVLGGMFLYGYFFTYLECNRKLEVDAMIEVIDSHQKPLDDADKGWFAGLFSFFSSESKATQQKMKLIKSSRLNLPYCRPDHVFIMYTNEIFLKQIEMLIEQASRTFSKLSTGLSFPYNLIAPFAMVGMMCYIIKLIFKYIIGAWISHLNNRSSVAGSITHLNNRSSVAGSITQQGAIAGDVGEDRVSGDNLKMLLNVLAAPKNQQQTQPQKTMQPVSGVQELLEPIEAPNQTSHLNNDKLIASSSSTDIAQEAGFTVVDDNDEVEHVDS